MNIKYIKHPQHHAYIIFSPFPDGLHTQEKDGLYVIHTERGLSVDEVRLLGEYASQTAGSTRRVVVVAPSISFHAQNALLKMLEETQRLVHFFFYLPVGTHLLDTLLSRCYIIERASAADPREVTEHFEKFITASAAERLAMVDTIFDEEKAPRHTMILRLLQDFETHIHQRIACITNASLAAGSTSATVTEDSTSDAQEREIVRLLHRKKAVDTVRSALRTGALNRGTLQVLAICLI